MSCCAASEAERRKTRMSRDHSAAVMTTRPKGASQFLSRRKARRNSRFWTRASCARRTRGAHHCPSNKTTKCFIRCLCGIDGLRGGLAWASLFFNHPQVWSFHPATIFSKSASTGAISKKTSGAVRWRFTSNSRLDSTLAGWGFEVTGDTSKLKTRVFPVAARKALVAAMLAAM